MFLFLVVTEQMAYNMCDKSQGLLDKDTTIFHMFLPQYSDTRPLLVHLTLFALHSDKEIDK